MFTDIYTVGHIDGCKERPRQIDIPEEAYEYASTTGTKELRKAVANLYNEIYRKNKSSKYTEENVCIVPGGRAGLSRLASAMGDVNVGYFLPEYTAYEQMLSVFRRFVPIPTALEEETRYHISPETLKKEISSRGLSVIVASNPRNPTGQVIQDDELAALVQIAKERHTAMIMDEFYSAYIYDREEGKTVSITEFVEDVNEDPIIVVDGLTKNYRVSLPKNEQVNMLNPLIDAWMACLLDCCTQGCYYCHGTSWLIPRRWCKSSTSACCHTFPYS